jgi:hypothetical protein
MMGCETDGEFAYERELLASIDLPILDQAALSRETEKLRQELSGEDEACDCDMSIQDICICDVLNVVDTGMDFHERNDAAAKLLQPVETGREHLTADLDDTKMLMMLIEYWKIVAPAFARTTSEADLLTSSQFEHTRSFVCQAWGITCSAPTNLPT